VKVPTEHEEEYMTKRLSSGQISTLIVLGAVWGLAEASLGLGLQKCASLASGSIMTAVALFFIAATWVLTGRILGLFIAVLLVSLIKLFDAFLLYLPLRHGAVANPIFAFWTEALAFVVIALVLKETLKQKKPGQAALGGLAALVAVNLFPLARFATGIPACVYPGTNYPLSLYYAPLAISLSLLTVPLGFWAGHSLAAVQARKEAFGRTKTFRYVTSPALVILCLVIIAVIRLAG
jgi:hypothetical protein